jgi:hypothetical protein
MVSSTNLNSGLPQPSSLSTGMPPLADPTLSSTNPSVTGTLTTPSLLPATAGTTTGSSLPGGLLGTDGDLGSIFQQLMMVMTMMLSLMTQLFQGGGMPTFAAQDYGNYNPNAQAPGDFIIPEGLSSEAPLPGNTSQNNGGPGNSSADSSGRLDSILAKVATDPEGAKLLNAAKANGYSIEVGDPSKYASGQGDADSIYGVTVPDQKKIVISPNAPDFDKTVIHELVHAATQGDGDSKTEEGMADVIGYRIASRVDGTQAPGSERQIFQSKIANYPNLANDNHIIDALNTLGIQA